jgi:hypothetical protein
MAVFRQTMTLTGNKGEGIDADVHVDESNATTNYGDSQTMSIGGDTLGPDRQWMYMSITLPSAPADCDTDQDYEGIVTIKVYLYLKDWTATSSSPHSVRIYKPRPPNTFAEESINWNNQPCPNGYEGLQLNLTDFTLSAAYKSLEVSDLRLIGLGWDESSDLFFLNQKDDSGKFSNFCRNLPKESQT